MKNKTDIEVYAAHKLSAVRALLGAITDNIRAVLIGWDEEKIYLKFVTINDPTEEEHDSLSIAINTSFCSFKLLLIQAFTKRTSILAMDLLSVNELPEGFEYPHQFTHIIELGLINLEPWYILEGKQLRDALAGISVRFPHRILIPFARRQDNDDIACWQSESNKDIYIVHDFSSPGWEQHAHFNCFYGWLRRAIDDLIEFNV